MFFIGKKVLGRAYSKKYPEGRELSIEHVGAIVPVIRDGVELFIKANLPICHIVHRYQGEILIAFCGAIEILDDSLTLDVPMDARLCKACDRLSKGGGLTR